MVFTVSVRGSGHERDKCNANRTFAELSCARVSLLSGGLTVSLIKPVITPQSYKHRPEISLDWLEAHILFHFIFAWICSHKIVADEKQALLQCKLPACWIYLSLLFRWPAMLWLPTHEATLSPLLHPLLCLCWYFPNTRIVFTSCLTFYQPLG